MYRPFWGSVCCLAALVLAACSEQPQQENPSTTAFAANSTNNCAPNVFSSLIAGYFTNPRQQKVADYKTAMLNARAAGQVATARTNGFHIMREIAAAAKTLPQPPASVGSELTVETLKCIFDVTDTHVIDSPPGAPFFGHALDRAAAGGYDVRGKPADLPTDPGDPTGTVQAVKSGSLTATAAVAPNGITISWDSILPDADTLNPPNARVLIYGEPGATAGSYHWSTIPRDAFFVAPGAVVTTCHEDGGDFTEMVTETFGTSSGALAWVEATNLCSPVVTGALDQGRGVFALFGQLAGLGRNWLVPQPLEATVVSPGLTGGNAGSLKSLFDVTSVDSVTLAFKDQPQNAFTNQEIPPPVTVTATSSKKGPIAGVEVTLVLVNNNGSKVKPSNRVASTKIELVNGQPVAIARFTGMTTNKAGGYALQIESGKVTGRTSAVILPVPPFSQKFNVKQSK